MKINVDVDTNRLVDAVTWQTVPTPSVVALTTIPFEIAFMSRREYLDYSGMTVSVAIGTPLNVFCTNAMSSPDGEHDAWVGTLNTAVDNVGIAFGGRLNIPVNAYLDIRVKNGSTMVARCVTPIRIISPVEYDR